MGNIITTITICLIVGQAANLVKIFTEFSSHVNFMAADIVMYAGLLGAFFWLQSLGYYIWKTFRYVLGMLKGWFFCVCQKCLMQCSEFVLSLSSIACTRISRALIDAHERKL